MYTGGNAGFDLSGQFHISMWVYLADTDASAGSSMGLWCIRGDGYEGPLSAVTHSGGNYQVTFTADDGGSGPWHTNVGTGYGSFKPDNWNFLEWYRGSDNMLTIAINGIAGYKASNSQDFYYNTAMLARLLDFK